VHRAHACCQWLVLNNAPQRIITGDQRARHVRHLSQSHSGDQALRQLAGGQPIEIIHDGFVQAFTHHGPIQCGAAQLIPYHWIRQHLDEQLVEVASLNSVITVHQNPLQHADLRFNDVSIDRWKRTSLTSAAFVAGHH
jgi:hypothetical protein